MKIAPRCGGNGAIMGANYDLLRGALSTNALTTLSPRSNVESAVGSGLTPR